MAKQVGSSCFLAVLLLSFLAGGFCQHCKSVPSFKNLVVSQVPTQKVQGYFEWRVSVTVRNLCGCTHTNVQLSCPGFNSVEAVDPNVLSKNGDVCVIPQIQPHQTDPKEGRSTLRPADILVYNWSEGKHACVDVTGASPMVGLGAGIFDVGLAASNAAAAKVEKHDGACRANQHSFIPFAFDTFGLLGSEAVELLRRVQKVMDSNVMTAGSNEYVFRRIGFAIQKGLAAQFVARLSSMFV